MSLFFACANVNQSLILETFGVPTMAARKNVIVPFPCCQNAIKLKSGLNNFSFRTEECSTADGKIVSIFCFATYSIDTSSRGSIMKAYKAYHRFKVGPTFSCVDKEKDLEDGIKGIIVQFITKEVSKMRLKDIARMGFEFIDKIYDQARAELRVNKVELKELQVKEIVEFVCVKVTRNDDTTDICDDEILNTDDKTDGNGSFLECNESTVNVEAPVDATSCEEETNVPSNVCTHFECNEETLTTTESRWDRNVKTESKAVQVNINFEDNSSAANDDVKEESKSKLMINDVRGEIEMKVVTETNNVISRASDEYANDTTVVNDPPTETMTNVCSDLSLSGNSSDTECVDTIEFSTEATDSVSCNSYLSANSSDAECADTNDSSSQASASISCHTYYSAISGYTDSAVDEKDRRIMPFTTLNENQGVLFNEDTKEPDVDNINYDYSKHDKSILERDLDEYSRTKLPDKTLTVKQGNPSVETIDKLKVDDIKCATSEQLSNVPAKLKRNKKAVRRLSERKERKQEKIEMKVESDLELAEMMGRISKRQLSALFLC